MVEFTLVLPLFLLLIFAIIVFSLAVHTVIDYNSAVDDAVRQSTLIDYTSGTETFYDDAIGQAALLGMRSDNPDRANYYDVNLIQSRNHLDAGSNTYENFYSYNRGSHAFVIDPYVYIAQNLGSSAPTPCEYYYGAHSLFGVDYLDQSQQIPMTDPTALQHLASLPSTDPLFSGCGRDTDDPNVLTCANNGQSGTTGHLCYYYPEERVNTVDASQGSNNAALPDLVETDINYTFHPLGVMGGPLSFGFTVSAHARARIEPVNSAS
jgi:hypothetical protein